MTRIVIDEPVGRGRVVVLGATGHQGGAVVSALLAQGRPVAAVLRDPAGERARAMARSGVEVVRGDLRDPSSLRRAFTGAHGVFSVQPSSGQAGSGISDDDEVAFGLAVADAAEHAGVRHLVYSSANAAGGAPTGVGHFDTKTAIERRVRALPIATTVLRPAAFMEILLLPGTSVADGTVSFLMRADQPMQVVAVDDVGRVAALAFEDPGAFSGRTLELAGDAVSGDLLAQSLGRATGRAIRYRRFSDDLLSQDPLLGRLAGLLDNGPLAGRADLRSLRTELPFLLTFDEWLRGPGASHLASALRSGGGQVGLR